MDLYPPNFTMQKVMAITGWDTEEYKTRRRDLVERMKARWSSSRDVNSTELRGFLQSNIGPYSRDRAWFDQAASKSVYSTESRERQRLQWYLRWATYIKGQSTWDAPFGDMILVPAKPVDTIESTPIKESHESIEYAETIKEATIDQAVLSDMQAHSPKRSVSQATQSTNAQSMFPNDPRAYRWDAGYLHIDFTHCDDFKTITLGLLVPEGNAIDCSYLRFKHEDLLQQLEKSEVIRPGEVNFRLTYRREGREFDLADEQGYLCALGDFSRQSGASQHTFEPMYVTLQMKNTDPGSLSNRATKRAHGSAEAGNKDQVNESEDYSWLEATNEDILRNTRVRLTDFAESKTPRSRMRHLTHSQPVSVSSNAPSKVNTSASTRSSGSSALQQAGHF